MTTPIHGDGQAFSRLPTPVMPGETLGNASTAERQGDHES
jgi:hypothetical protein